MEDKEIKTVLEKITDAKEIERLQLNSTEELITIITRKEGLNILTCSLPIKPNNQLGIKFGNSEIIYLGIIDKNTRKFIQNYNTNETSNYIFVFANEERTKFIYRPVDSQRNLITLFAENTDIQRFNSLYSFSFDSLDDTKKVFGLATKKMAFANTKIVEYDIDEYEEVYILSNRPSIVLTAKLGDLKSKHDDTGKVKFCIKDLRFTALLDLRGYNIKKDKNIKVSTEVNFRFKDSVMIGIVKDIKTLPSQYMDKKGNPIKNRIFYVVSEGFTYRLRQKDLKLV